MKQKSSLLKKHNDHQCDAVLTPELSHYGKLVCRDCGGQWLQWLTRSDCETLLGPQPKKPPKIKKTNWSNTTKKERQHYESYQPRNTLELPRTPTQLIRDRLALTGYSRYNGNSIYSVPASYLQALLDTNKVTRKEDRQMIQAAIDLQNTIGA